jgi:uncharacterized protein YodC (DUF2158 family)
MSQHIRRGGVVRTDGSPPMLVASFHGPMVQCWFVDGAAVLRKRFYDIDSLTPLEVSLSPKSLWPDITQLDLLEIEAEERKAREEAKIAKRKAKRAKRSQKLKRKKAA